MDAPQRVRQNGEETSTREQLLAGGKAIEAATDLGPMLLERDAELLTPTVLVQGIWEPTMSLLMRRYLRPGMTVVDAGANIGYLSVLASQLVRETGRVFSVEADPGNVAILKANLDRLGKGNATVLPIAAWHEDATLNLVSGEQGGAGSFVVPVDDPKDGQVRAAPLGELIEDSVDFMKVDCEFTDHLVVKGAERLIDANPDMLITVEFSPDFTGHTGFNPEEVLGVYRELGLSPYLISPNGAFERTSFEQLAARHGAGGDLSLFDFALCRGEPSPLRRTPLRWRAARGFDAVLRFGGNLLEHVPERIRPKILHRDRLRN